MRALESEVYAFGDMAPVVVYYLADDVFVRRARRDKCFARLAEIKSHAARTITIREELFSRSRVQSCRQFSRSRPRAFNLRRDLTGGCYCPERGSRSSQRHSSRFWCWLSAADRPGASGAETAARRPVSRASDQLRELYPRTFTLWRYRSLPSRNLLFLSFFPVIFRLMLFMNARYARVARGRFPIDKSL